MQDMMKEQEDKQNSQKAFERCTLCPRRCQVNRLAGQKGYCGQTAQLRAARAALHFWEEPCISGREGSGAVFFSGCPMRCVFCQNYEIAAGDRGKEITAQRLAEIFLELQKKGANNINLVTPTHFVPLIVPALQAAKINGLNIPVVYNTSSYENVETLKMLEGLVDIYLPDLKYVSSGLAGALSNAPDYFETAAKAIAEMVRQVGEPVFADQNGNLLDAAAMNEACEDADEDADFLMKKGVIVRHLALPGQAEDSKKVLKYLHMPGIEKRLEGLKGRLAASLEHRLASDLTYRLSENEYEALIDFAIEIGIENGFLQDGETAQESFIPDFDGEGL